MTVAARTRTASAITAMSLLMAAFQQPAAGHSSGARAGFDPPKVEQTGAPIVAAVSGRSRPQLPHGGRLVFPRYRLVAFYGTAHTGALGVLGEASPDRITRRLRGVAANYRDGDRRVQIVYELIVAVADGGPGRDGDYSHFIPDSYVREYIRASRRNKALLVLDIQPGRSNFVPMVEHYRWALEHAWVGVALDPEWRMHPGQVPGRVIGHVDAAEVNRAAAYVARLTHRNDLPQKVFVIHEFRTDMVRRIGLVRHRPSLAMVQHMDGFGTRRQKLATYHAVERSDKFHLGFKLFYDEDVHRFHPKEVLGIRPRVAYVSYQ